MIWFAFSLRSERGFKRMKMRPLFALPPPMADMKFMTFGSAAAIFATAI